jgi:plastocyanin
VPLKQVEVDALGRVTRAVVWTENGSRGGKLPALEVTLDQRRCFFVPIVQAATVGSTLVVTSSDPLLHNVHIKDATGATVANVSMPVMGQQIRVPLKKPGVLSIHCEAGHAWMRAAIVVFDHPNYDVTVTGGRFELRDVAPGPHRVIAFHPELGRVERTVVVGETKIPVRVDLAF